MSVTLQKSFFALTAPFNGLAEVLITQPLADVLALKTYTHGTNFFNYIDIRCHGAVPKEGGKTDGSTAVTVALVPLVKRVENWERQLWNEANEKVKNHFYVFKDISDEMFSYPQMRFLVRTLLPRAHAILSGMGMWIKPEETGLIFWGKMIAGGIVGLCTPIVSIRSATGEDLGLENDPDYGVRGGPAYRTNRAILPSSMGIIGVIKEGCKQGFLERVSAAPIKVAIGALRLAILAHVLWAYVNRHH